MNKTQSQHGFWAFKRRTPCLKKFFRGKAAKTCLWPEITLQNNEKINPWKVKKLFFRDSLIEDKYPRTIRFKQRLWSTKCTCKPPAVAKLAFRLYGKEPVFMDFFMQLVNIPNVNSFSFDIWVSIIRSWITFFTASTETDSKEKLQTLLNLTLMFLILGWFLYRLIILWILSEPSVRDKEWSSQWFYFHYA